MTSGAAAEPEARPEAPQPTGTNNETMDDEKSAAYNAANYLKESPQVSGPHLSEMQPDYAISVRLEGESSDGDLSRLKAVSGALQRQGLYVQFRQGKASGYALALVKCSSKRLRTQAQRGAVNDWLHGVRARNPGDDDEEENDNAENNGLTPAERLRLVYEIITTPKDEGGAGLTPGVGEWEFVESIFPLHNHELNSQLIKRWSTRWLLDESEISAIRKQFGDKVAMYFAFLQFYFRWSLVPTLIGLGTYFVLGSYSPTFAVFNALWGIAFIEGWRRRQDQLAIRWGVKGCATSDAAAGVRRRAAFRPEKQIIDPVSGAQRPYYPSFKREIKKLAFIPFALLVGVALVGFQSLCFVIEIFIGQIYDGPFKSVLIFLPTILLVGLTPTFGAAYGIASSYVTGWENHESEDAYEQSSTAKQFAFHFLVSFMALFLTAYVYLPFGHHLVQHLGFVRNLIQTHTPFNISTAESFELDSWRLHQQVFYFVVTANVINFAMETVVPYVQRKVFSKAKQWTQGEVQFNDDPDEAAFLNEVRAQADYPVYDVHEDYRQLVVQFGYTILFGIVWPLAPMAQIFNNWVQLRGDAVKICLDMQRPIPQRCESIGPWTNNLYFLSWIGSIVSSSIIAMFGNVFTPQEQDDGYENSLVQCAPWKILVTVIVAEHLYVLARGVIHSALSSVESKDHVEHKQQEYKVRQKYLNEKRQIVDSDSHHQLGVGTIDPIENQWSSLSQSDLEKQAQSAIQQPKTIKEKKSE